MFSLCAIGCQQTCLRKRRPDLTLAMIGLDNAGKSTIIATLQQEDVESVTQTIGFQAEDVTFQRRSLHFFDLGGGERIRGIWNRYYAESHGLVFVVDGTDTEHMSRARDVLAETVSHQFVAGKPVLVLINKSDKEDCVSIERARSLLALDTLANQERPCIFRVETCSAISSPSSSKSKDNNGIIAGLAWLVDAIDHDFDAVTSRHTVEVARQKSIEKEEREAKREQIRQRKLREQEAANGASETEGNAVPAAVTEAWGSRNEGDGPPSSSAQAAKVGTGSEDRAAAAELVTADRPTARPSFLQRLISGRVAPDSQPETAGASETDSQLTTTTPTARSEASFGSGASVSRQQSEGQPSLPTNVIDKTDIHALSSHAASVVRQLLAPADESQGTMASPIARRASNIAPTRLDKGDATMPGIPLALCAATPFVNKAILASVREGWSRTVVQAKGRKRFAMDKIAHRAHQGWAVVINNIWDQDGYGPFQGSKRTPSSDGWPDSVFASASGYELYRIRRKIANSSFETVHPQAQLFFRIIAELLLDQFLSLNPDFMAMRVKKRRADLYTELVSRKMVHNVEIQPSRQGSAMSNDGESESTV